MSLMRRGGREDEGVPLETGYPSVEDGSGVRIPPSPWLFCLLAFGLFSHCAPPLPSDRTLIYLINHLPDEVVVIDPKEAKILRKSIAGDFLSAMSFLPGDEHAVITAEVSLQIRLYNLKRGVVEKILSTPGFPQKVVAHPSLPKIYLFLADQETITTSDVTVVDIKTFQIVKRVPIVSLLNRMAVSPDGKYLLVTSAKHNRIFIVDALKDELMDEYLEVSHSPSYFIFTPDSKKVLVAYNFSDVLQIFDLESKQVEKTIAVGDAPNYVSASKDGKQYYVADLRSRDIQIIDAEKQEVTKTVRLDYAPAFIQPGKNFLYIITENKFLIVVDANSGEIVRSIPLKSKPVDFALRNAELG